MKVLLDTTVFLWAVGEPTRLSNESWMVIGNPAHPIFVSAASLWELSIKQQSGQVVLPGPVEDWIPVALRTAGFATLDIMPAHALLAGKLHPHHGDPLDRMLVAQAMLEDLTLATRDPFIARYNVRTLMA
ncbi:MAG: type II toxin-antitoxin system VapC family toxin [Rhodospirillaceae bacterium]|nr:type II toxin-antitoxin system VapC family toxin [Rhodospirillaceae bacterium]